jgi:hypothetical protein
MQAINNSSKVVGKLTRSEAGKLGWLKTKELHEASLQKRINDYKNNPNFCFQCGEMISYEKRFNKFCSQSCGAKFNNNKRKLKTYEIKCLSCSNIIKDSRKQRKYCSTICQAKEKNKNVIEQWKIGKNKGYSGKTMLVPPWLRRYLFEKFNSKCCKCGWCEINPTTNKIPLEVNHIDGNAANSKEQNLELLCPNCHSLTPNFRALNKKSKRIRK